MALSIPGLIIFLGLFAFGYWLRAPIIIGLFASIPFGSTAIVSLPALGGSSPMVYTAFIVLLIATAMLRRGALDELNALFANHWTPWIVTGLIMWAVGSAIVFPRLFAGQATAIIALPSGAKEVPLGPVSGNVTQAGYLVAGALNFYALAILLKREKGTVAALRRGFLAYGTVNAVLGILDLSSKIAGVGDLLAPIRTANYANLVEVEEAGFWRIAGGFPEASAFGAVTLACLAFCYADWRVTRSRYAFALGMVLFVLLILSTSSTAYAGLGIVSLVALAFIAVSAIRGRITIYDLILLGIFWTVVTFGLLVFLADEQLLEPLINLFDRTILQKAASASAQERFYWNQKALEAFYSTSGIGIGLGSSRASSWAIAVLSQLGVVGAALMALLVGVLVWDLFFPKGDEADVSFTALAAGARAATLAALCAATIAGGSADPGPPFFVALAIVAVRRSGALGRSVRRAGLAVAGRG
jgi:hypothetical protein